MNTQTLQNLRDDFEKKTSQQVKDELEEIGKMGMVSVNVETFFAFMDDISPTYMESRQASTEFFLNTTPDFSGSFFLV